MPALQGRFVAPTSGWVLYDKHKSNKNPAAVSRPGKVETDAVRKLNAERDAIRAQQAQREAARKVLHPLMR